MSTADFVRPIIYHWSVKKEMKEPEGGKMKVSQSSASLIDDITAFKESQQSIPRSEVTPTYIQSLAPKPVAGAIDIDAIVAKYKKPVRAPRKKKTT